MTLKDSNPANKLVFWFTLFDIEDVPPEEIREKIINVMGRLRKNASGDYTFFMEKDDGTGSFILKARKNTYDLDRYLSPVGEREPYSQISEVTNVYVEKNGDVQIELTMVFFADTDTYDVSVGLGEKIIETAEKTIILNKFNSTKADVLGQFLLEHCVIKVGPDNYFLIYAGEDDDAGDEETQTENSSPSAFAICGDQAKIAVEINNEGYCAAKKITFKNALNGANGLRLIKGNLSFYDWTKGGEKMSAIQMEILKKLAELPQSYLRIWEDYVRADGNRILTKARNFGVLKCKDDIKLKSEETWAVYLDEESTLPKELAASEENVEFIDNINEKPPYIDDENIDWIDFLKKEKDIKLNKGKAKNKPRWTIKSVSGNCVTVEVEKKPSGKYMILSIQGEKTMHTRRVNAKNAILQRRSAMEDLGILIEAKADYTARGSRSNHKAVTPYIREKIFKGNELFNQEEAVDIAINTPDICLIQGPPGTGKTTVITAIIERLNEIYGRTDDLKGRILITSFQHAAVENLAERLRINSIPPVKFGKTSDKYKDEFKKWGEKFADRIEATHPDISKSVHSQEIHAAFAVYQESPSAAHAFEILKKIRALSDIILTCEIKDKIETIEDSLKEDLQETDAELIRKIRSLRVTSAAFYDDGPAQAMDLYIALEERQELDENRKQILMKAAVWNPGKGDVSFLKELRELKVDLLRQFLPKPQFRIDKQRADIIDLIDDVERLLEKTKKFEDKRKNALAAFYNELKYNPIEIADALKDYSVVYAATVNFAGSEKMTEEKTNLSEGIIAYDTVVVDEAARANPPDLLIALTQGRKIILVGDDRQLPQLIEDNLVDKVLENVDTDIRKETEDTLRMSMFEYLKNRIIQLEQKDDIKRFIQLKTQFRMHPFLGDFVSEQFYENSLGNGIKDVELFRHDLPGTDNKPALWHDVPFLQDRGPEKSGTSLRRRSEAIYIAQKLSEWIDIQGPNGKKFSFGVISFYAAQTPTLLEALNAKGLCEKQDNGLHVKEQYVDRLEVGTVDAFQGKEFDVVFLSLVRSRDINNIKSDRKTFGHLVFTNRLCVGMSRQKKLLVVVGDRELMKTEAARDHVPALYNFCNICQTEPEGGML